MKTEKICNICKNIKIMQNMKKMQFIAIYLHMQNMTKI